MKNFIASNKDSFLIFLIVFIIFTMINLYETAVWIHQLKTDPGITSLNIITGEEPTYLEVVSTIIRHHSIYLDDFFLDKNPDPNLTMPYFFYNLNYSWNWHAFKIDNGHYVAGDGPGLSYILVPGYFIGGIFGAFMTMSFASSFTSILMYKFASKFTNKKIGFLTTMIFTFATILIVYCNTVYADVIIMLFCIFIIYCIFEKSNSNLYMAFAGASLGFGVFLKISFVSIDVILLPVLLIFLIKHRISSKNFLIFIGLFITFSLFAILNNMYSYHSIFGQENTVNSLNFLNSNESTRYLILEGFINLFFGKYQGLFIFSPILAMFVFGVGLCYKKNNFLMVTIALLSLSLIVGYVLANPWGALVGNDPPHRYLIPLIPLISIPFALGFERFVRNPIYIILLLGLLTISIAFSLEFNLHGRFSSLAHLQPKEAILHAIYGKWELMMPTPGPAKFGDYPLPENHSIGIYNILFMSSVTIALVIGAVISFLEKSKKVTSSLFYLCLIIALGIFTSPILFDQIGLSVTNLNPISHFEFENNVFDNGILKNNGTVIGKEIYAEGKIGKGFEFIGNNSIIFPNVHDYNFERKQPFSVSYWLKRTSDKRDADSLVINKLKPSSGEKGWRIESGNGYNIFRITDNSTRDDITLDVGGITDDKWHLIMFTYDGNGVTGGMKGYIDGKLIATGGGGNLSSTITNDYPASIGSSYNKEGNFIGELDDVRIYNKELSSADANFLFYGFLSPSTITIIVVDIVVISLIIITKTISSHMMQVKEQK
jgi:hypothetical protein